MISTHYCEHCERASVVAVSQRRYAEINLTDDAAMDELETWSQTADTQTDADGGSIHSGMHCLVKSRSLSKSVWSNTELSADIAFSHQPTDRCDITSDGWLSKAHTLITVYPNQLI